MYDTAKQGAGLESGLRWRRITGFYEEQSGRESLIPIRRCVIVLLCDCVTVLLAI